MGSRVTLLMTVPRTLAEAVAALRVLRVSRVEGKERQATMKAGSQKSRERRGRQRRTAGEDVPSLTTRLRSFCIVAEEEKEKQINRARMASIQYRSTGRLP